jgi:stage V sporulation protein B
MLVGFKWGIYSLVVGNIIFSLCMCFLNARAIKQVSGYQQEVKKTYFIPIGAAVIMAVVIIIVWNGLAILVPERITTLLTIAIAAMAYGIALFKLGALSPSEVKALPKGTMILKFLQKLRLIKAE